jgi:hypothetical protein
MVNENKIINKWLNASRSLFVITAPAFLWFVLGGTASLMSQNKPHYTYLGIAGIGIILGIIQWAINTRQKWAVWTFYVLVPINILGSFWGWLSLLFMLIYWKKMIKLLKTQTKTKDLKNRPEIIDSLA